MNPQQPNPQPSLKTIYGIVRQRRFANQPQQQQPPQQQPPQQPQRPQQPLPQRPQRPPFGDPTAIQNRKAKQKSFEDGADLATNLQGARDLLKKSADKGGVDRGLTSGGAGEFGKVLDELKEVESIEAKGKDSRAAIQKLHQKNSEWLKADKADLQKDPSREKDPVAVRKRQAAETLMLQYKATESAKKMDQATDWDTYQEAEREAETAMRNFQVASLTIKTPPARIGGSDFSDPNNPPKGQSDSYFVKDGNTTKYIFKPQSGEYVADGYPPGGGAPREVLMSEFNEEMKGLGFDFGVAKTSVASLTSHDFTNGKNDKATSRVGVVQDAFQGATDAEDKFKELEKQGGPAIKAFKDSISTEDVHNVAVMDFLTLNLDRNPGNAMFLPDQNDPTKTRLMPIDAGNLLPPEAVFDADAGFGGVSDVFDVALSDPEAPIKGNNVLMQLPQSAVAFDAQMIQKIQALNPAQIAGMLRKNNAKRQGGMAGKIGEDTFQMVEESTAFLQAATAQQPALTVNEIGKLYAMNEGFKAYKTARRTIVTTAKTQGTQPDFTPLTALVQQAAALARQKTQDDTANTAYKKQDGDKVLGPLGWGEADLKTKWRLTPAQKLDLVTNKTTKLDFLMTQYKIAKTDLPNNFDTSDAKTQIAIVEDMAENRQGQADVDKQGGDQEIQRVVDAIRQAGAKPDPDKDAKDMTGKEKIYLLERWQEFGQLGGYIGYRAALQKANEPGQAEFKDQPGDFKRLISEAASLVEAEKAGGEASFKALIQALGDRGITADDFYSKQYAQLKPHEKRKLTQKYQAIKDLEAFKNYNALVQKGAIVPPKTKKLDFLETKLKGYKE